MLKTNVFVGVCCACTQQHQGQLISATNFRTGGFTLVASRKMTRKQTRSLFQFEPKPDRIPLPSYLDILLYCVYHRSFGRQLDALLCFPPYRILSLDGGWTSFFI
jgi:hypothetical protein